MLTADIEIEKEDRHAIENMPEAVRADPCIFTTEYFLDIHLKENPGYRDRYDTGYEVVFICLAGLLDFEVDASGNDQQDNSGHDGFDEVVSVQEKCEHEIDTGKYRDHDEAAFGADGIGRLTLDREDDAMRKVHSRKQSDAVYRRKIHFRKKLNQ